MIGTETTQETTLETTNIEQTIDSAANTTEETTENTVNEVVDAAPETTNTETVVTEVTTEVEEEEAVTSELLTTNLIEATTDPVEVEVKIDEVEATQKISDSEESDTVEETLATSSPRILTGFNSKAINTENVSDDVPETTAAPEVTEETIEVSNEQLSSPAPKFSF